MALAWKRIGAVWIRINPKWITKYGAAYRPVEFEHGRNWVGAEEVIED
jgi:hypothetical protein